MAQKKIRDFFKAASADQTNELDSSGTEEDEMPSTLAVIPDDETVDHSFTSSSTCQCQCCSDLCTPYQPSSVGDSKVSHSYHTKDHGNKKSHSRKIQTNWYKIHPWITVCTSQYKVYCATCRCADNQGLLHFPKHSQSAFTHLGFSNWKKALQKFREHEASSMHKEATLKVAAKSHGLGIDIQLSDQHSTDQNHHRCMLIKLLRSVQYLSRQGLPLRGHKENMESFGGNLYQLLLLQAKDFPEMMPWLRQREYISPEIVNEIITTMGLSVLRNILTEINAASWFSIIADEAADIAGNERMSLSVRWVDHDYNIHEATLGLIELPDTKAMTICSLIKDVLLRSSLPINKCRGQAFDGAANMSGIKNGVQALVKKEEPKALYVHCLAHNLNLCVKDVTKTCDIVRDAMNFVFELTQLIKKSPKRHTLFENLRRDVIINTGQLSPKLRMLCPTRWTVRHTSIASILKNYNTLQNALEEISQGHDEYAARASGMANKMDNFDTYYGLKLAYLVFSASDQFSTNLQARDITVQEAIKGARCLISHMQSLRSEEKFDSFYDQVLCDSKDLTATPTLPRRRKMPRRYDDGASPHIYADPKERYRHIYFEVTELTAGEVERRFSQNDLDTTQNIESLLLGFANGNNDTLLPASLNAYLEDDFDLERLKVLLLMIPDVIRTAFSGTTTTIKQVTSIRTISAAMNGSEIYKGMLQEVNKLLRLYLTYPVTSATAERSFSSLHRIKTYLRSTMTECRLNNLFLLYIHQERTDSLDLTEVARIFVSVNQRRMNYFGNF